MFDSFQLYQPEISSRIAREVQDSVFPHAVLFHGPRFSGRMSLALETCRVLSCRVLGDDRCVCASCKAFASLETPNVVIISMRDHRSILETAMGNLVEHRNASVRDFLIRSTRIMLLQYHGALMEESNQKTASAFDAASSVNEILYGIGKINDETPPVQIERWIKELREALKPLFLLAKKNTTVTISQVRAIQEWMGRTSLDGLPRFVILEGIEQSTEGARNSLLKLLEEPPADSYFFLISENAGRIMQTILSRVRRYYVPPLGEDAKTTLLNQRFFADGEAFDSLETYFLTKSGVDCAAIGALAYGFLKGILGTVPMEMKALDAMINQIDESGQSDYFIHDLMCAVEQEFLDGTFGRVKASAYMSCIKETVNRGSVFNQNRKLWLEALYYRLLETP